MFSKSGVWTFGFGFWASWETCSYSLSLGLVFGLLSHWVGWFVGFGFCAPTKNTKTQTQKSKHLHLKTNQPTQCVNKPKPNPKDKLLEQVSREAQNPNPKVPTPDFENIQKPKAKPPKSQKPKSQNTTPGKATVEKVGYGHCFCANACFQKRQIP
jgi:outer membrane biosynthesis protein TonB